MNPGSGAVLNLRRLIVLFSQEFLMKQMEDYFFGEGAALPPDYVPPRAKG